MEIKHSRNIRAINVITKLVGNLSKNQKLQWCVQSSTKWFGSYFGLQFQRQRRREQSRVEIVKKEPQNTQSGVNIDSRI